METVYDWIIEATKLKLLADQWGYAYGFTSQKYFDALKPYIKHLDRGKKLRVSTKPRNGGE